MQSYAIKDGNKGYVPITFSNTVEHIFPINYLISFFIGTVALRTVITAITVFFNSVNSLTNL